MSLYPDIPSSNRESDKLVRVAGRHVHCVHREATPNMFLLAVITVIGIIGAIISIATS